MVSPSKAKLSRIASQQSQQQQQQPEPEPQREPPQRKSVASTSSATSKSKVKLVKGSKPLIHHRFYLDIERHQVATKIESTIKELGGTVEFFLSKTITHFITDKQQPVDSTGGSVAVVAAQTGEWNEEHQSQATTTTTPGANAYHRIAVAASPSSSAPATRSSLTNVANRRSQQAGRRTSARNTYHTHHPTPRQYNRGQYVNDIGSATSRTSSPCPPPASTTPTPPPATSSTALAGHVRQQRQKHQLGATAIASSSAGGGNSPSTAATPLATATLGFDGRVKPTQPAAAALPRSRADAMLQRVRQQQQQQQNQQHQPHHQPSYHLLPSSPLKYNISSPSAVTALGNSSATPIKRTDTPSPSTFNNPSSHHKQQPASPCYSPVPAPGAAGGEGWWENVTRSVSTHPVQNSPIQLASSWGTPVWSPEHALKFLRKVLDSVRNENHPEHKHRHHHLQHHHHRSVTGTRASSSSRHAHHLHGRFLKVESISSATAYRPFYQEFKQWPDLLLVRRHTRDLGEGKKAPFADANELPKATALKVTEAAALPVSTEVASGARMTRKLTARTATMVASARSASVQEQKPSTPNTAKKRAVTLLQHACETAANESKKDKTAPAPPKDCGYCEICRIEYDSLALHVDSESHRTFVQNDENFQSLDQLIGSIGEFGGNTDDGGDGGRFDLLGGLLMDNERKVGAAGGNEASAAAAAAAGDGGGGLSLHRENNETDERLLQLMEVEPQTGKRRNSLSTATVKTTVTTTTTAAVDEQQIDKSTELHKTIKEPANSSRQQRYNWNVKQARNNEASYEELLSSSCVAKAPESDAKQRTSVKRPTVKEQSEGLAELIDHDAAGEILSVPPGESTLEDQENSSLIKRAIASVIASFDAGSDDEEDESDSLVASEHNNTSPPVVKVKKTRKECSAASVQECGTSRGTPVVSKEAGREGKPAESECIVEQFIDFVVEEKDEQCSVNEGRGRRARQIVTGVAVHTPRRSSRTSGAAIEEPVLSGTEEAQRSLGSLTTEQAQESGGMFGRRSAIHHHPHNQLNHHKHQKHKSTLSALLLKQQQERQRQLLEEVQQRRDTARVESNCEAQPNLSSDQNSYHDPVDHAAGMKVISDYHHEQQSAELEKFSSEVSGVGLEQKQKPSVGRRKRGRGAGTVAIGHRRQHQQQQLEAPECQNKTLAAAMGLKASTTAMNKHHHHHHHLPTVDGGSDVVVGGLGAKTRLAEAALLECEGLDPKNTKRISLGLRQNPKRANLNDDFTSLLDETLERSRLISSSSTSSAATTTSAVPSAATSTVVARKAQARIRPLQHKTKDKDKPGKRKERPDIDTNDSAAHTLEQQSIGGIAGMKRGSTKKVGSAALEDIKVRGIRWRAPSPASRPPVKSPLLYKVIEPSMPPATAGNDDETTGTAMARAAGQGEHDASKSERKTGAQSSQRSRKPKSDQQQQSSPTKNGLIVKIRRVRQSELSLLNDEAENFMFPKKDESSSDSDTDDGRQTSSEGCRVPGAEAGVDPTRNNFSLDIPSSSELERTSKCVEDEDEEDDHDSEMEHDEENDGRTTGAAQRRDLAAKGCRKRRKPSSSNKLQAGASNRGESVESEPSSCASSSSGSSFVIEPIVKRARFDSQLMTTAADRLGSGGVKSGRRKASFGAVGVFDDGSDPPGSRTRFPTAPIQPTPVAVDERMTSTTATGGKQSYDNDDDNGDDEVENDNNAKKRVPSSGRGRGKKGRLRQVKHMDKEHPKSIDTPENDEITGGVLPLREDSVSSPSQLSTCTCYNTGNGSSNGAVRNRGRGSGRGGSRRGRRGRGGAASVAARSWAARGRGSRMPLCGCRLQLLDATRMPPPASPASPGRHDTLESRSDGIIGTGVVLGTRRSGASKTKTTPPALKSRRGASAKAGPDEVDHHQSHESSLSSTEAISGSYNIASNSSSNKGKEDGMGAVFKWINFRKRCEEIEPYRFAFERVPSLEPWYETFQRQDDATEQVYEYFGSTAYRKLPYEMGPLPALSQNCCILNYKVVACRKSNRTASQQSFSPSSVEPSSPSSKYRAAPSSEGPGGDLDTKKSPSSSSLSSLPLKKRKLLLAEGAANSSCSSTSTGSGGTGTGSGGAGDGSGSSGNRIARLIAGSDRPRKSPREHASTLAILSLLSQQQHRKRAAAIKILTSPKKATTTTAQSLLASQEKHHHHHQDTDSNSGHGDEQQRPSSATDRSGVSGAGGSSIKFERPLFPDSSYINSRNLCKELDAFLSEELEQVYGDSTSVKPALDEKQEERQAEAKDGTPEEPTTKQRLELKKSDEPSLQLPLSPSVLREGVAIERQQLPVSKRDLLDVLQTVRREPPLSLKLVQRCETVVKKIVQFDRKPRSMLASNGGYGGAVIGLQLFDGTNASALGGSGSGLGGGVGHSMAGCAGGSFLKKRINRTGWPTNKRKIGTRTRQQSRFLRPMMLSASSAESKPLEDVGEESVPVIKKEKDDEEDEEEEDEDEEEDHSEVRHGEAVEPEVDEREHDDNDEEEDDEEEDSGPEENEEEEDDGETVIEMAQRRRGRPTTVSSKKAGQSSINCSGKGSESSNQVLASHGKSERRNHHQTNNPERVTEPVERQKQQLQRRRSRKSSGSSTATTVAVGSSDCVAIERKTVNSIPAQDVTEQRRPPTSSSFYDTMPTLRAALMRDNSQQIQRQLSRSLGTTQSSPSNTLSSLPVSSPLSLTLPPPSPKISPTVGQQTLMNSPPKPTDPSMQQLLSPGSRVTASGVVGTACSKYVTKTTTTMTRVDYTGGPVGGCASNTDSGPATNHASNSSKPKRKSRDILRNEEAVASQRFTVDDVGSSTSTMVRMNRYPAQRGSTTNNTIDDDDKECDSISSRSIFVSDDCDTTSSSTMVNAPPEDAPHPTVDRHSVTTGHITTGIRDNDTPTVGSWKDRDQSVTAEDEEDEHDEREQQQSRSVVVGLQRSPRTPSERIRNKLVAKNRRMSALFKRRLSTTATSSPARVVKLSPAKLNVLSNNTQATVPAKRRGTTKPIEPVSLPPPSMMPLSPPLTTSTSSSSSSCADDKPMSPAVAVTASNIPASTDNSGIFASQPSKVKTRSATKGRPPVRRTYSGVSGSGRGRTKNASMLMMDHLNTTTIRLPYVSLVKTTFTGIDNEPSVMTIANSTPTTTSTTTTTTTASETTTIEKPSPKRKGAKRAKEAKPGRRAKLAKRGKGRGPRKQQRKVPHPATDDTEAAEEEHEEEEEEEDATPIVKVRRRKQIIAKREDDERLEEFNHDGGDDGEQHPVAPEHKPTKRKQQLKLKLFNHGNHHYTYDSTFSVTTTTTAEGSKEAQVEHISNGILEHDVGNANEGLKCHDSNVMSSETDEPAAQPDADEHPLVEEHLIEDEEHLLDTEDSEDDETVEGGKGSTKIEMLELMEVVENTGHEDEEDDQRGGDEDYNVGVMGEDTFLTGDEMEVEEQEEQDDLDELERSATRIMNNDHPYANSSEDLTHRHHQRYNHRQHDHHDHDHHGVTTDEEETEYVEVHELEAEVEEEEEEELDVMGEEGDVVAEEDHLHQLGEDDDEEDEESNEEEITQRTLLHASPLSNNSHTVTAASSLNSSAGKTSTGTATATATTTTSPNKYSPRKLRKPRGRWYRER
ncbi:uncharacterized protein LOC126579250 [Anopheles aquasalis]|uniref:uncharacterized protein LOC126579250 n=1 Tax=Anopheles aquasalis TaxID=42839 RepID=UPI00215A335F|nr:uncharacterized protein LOC126579250 [Anopheles aquasalis]